MYLGYSHYRVAVELRVKGVFEVVRGVKMKMDRVIRKVGVGCVFLILVGSLVMSALSAGSAQKTGNLANILDGLKEKSAGSGGLEESTGAQKDHGLAVSSNGAVDLQNQTKKVHVALSNASGLGRFTIGGYYNDAWQKLLYGYPYYGSTSYLTIRVDTTTTSVNYTTKSTAMDPYVVEPVHTIGEDAVSMTWRLPENITVQQTIRLVQDFARIEINVTNEGNSTKEIGVRYYYDTQVAARDDAPIYIPGVGVKTTQEEYLNPTFTYWKGYDHPTVPSVVSEAKISGEDATTPTKLQIDQYGSEQAWENTVYSGSPFSDSAVLTYWAPTDVAPAQTKQVVTYYGIGAPVVKGPFNISEILVDRITGSYCPDEQATIKVDVVSIDQTHEGLVKIDIMDGGEVLYSSPYSSTGTVPANGAATLQFNWTVGVAACGKSLDIKASLVNSS
ncbi:MAG: DUF937 domain-containing protein, partial [Methanomicrobia archaeon]|nr:DUF937 domain-containing protein [Methanomicrobia archaeon]